MHWVRGPLIALVAVVVASLPAQAGWPTYHHDLARSSVDPDLTGFAWIRPDWQSAGLDGAIYAEPLIAGNRVFAATQANSVYAFDATTGSLLWQRNLGAPYTASLPCGNLPMTGITSTPVVDPVAGVLYAVPFLQSGQYQLAALNVSDGSVRYQGTINPGFDPLVQGQRGALSLSQGLVYIPFGGRYGDCGNYHGWMVAAQASTGAVAGSYQVSPAPSRGGGIWSPAGASIDASGNVFVATGNGYGATFDHSESVIRLSPTLVELDFFAPADWQQLNNVDADIGSMGPALLDTGLAFQIGKTGYGYLLRTSALGGIGGQAFGAQVCGGAYGGTAYQSPLLFVPCQDGLVALRINADTTFSVAWRTTGFFAGPPILSGGIVWTVDRGGSLRGYDPATGQLRYTMNVGAVNNFSTPAAAAGRIYVAASTHIASFLTGSYVIDPNNPGYWLVASDGGVFTFGGLNFYGSMGGRPLNQPMVGMARTPDDGGYWLVAADGGIFTFGTARFFGSTGAMRLSRPVVGMAATPTGQGYWLVASDGGIFTFGDAGFYGSTGNLRLSQPIVGMAQTPDGKGYWLVAADGGIFAFGSASFYGSTGSMRLNQPIVGMAATPDAKGYWLVASDGGIFSFGTAGFYGSTGSMRLNRPVIGLARTRSGIGYWLAAADGGIFAFGDAPFYGSTGGIRLNQPINGMVAG